MTIKIYKANDGKSPYKIIGGNVCYSYDDESKVISVYTGDTWVHFHIVTIISTYQSDEVRVYESWDDSKDCFGIEIGELLNIKDELDKYSDGNPVKGGATKQSPYRQRGVR